MKLSVKTGVKVLVVAILSLAAGGTVWYECQPRLVCVEPSVVREAIPIKRDQTFFEHTYIVHNRSLRTVILDGVKSSCACQSVEVPDPVIPPFGEGKITARFNVARNAAGARHAESLVFANKRSLPVLRLKMTYSFELGVWAYPEQIELGRVVSGKPVEFEILVRQAKAAEGNAEIFSRGDAEARRGEAGHGAEDAAGSRIHIGGVEGKGMTFEVQDARDNDALTEQKITGRFVNQAGAGYHEQAVVIKTDHPDYPVLTVPVRWESVAELNFTPTVLHFGVMGTASASSRTVTLIAESGPLHVRRAEVSGDGFRLEARNQTATNRVEFLIGANAGTVPGVYKGRLTVETEDGKACRAELIAIVE